MGVQIPGMRLSAPVCLQEKRFLSDCWILGKCDHQKCTKMKQFLTTVTSMRVYKWDFHRRILEYFLI